ncbi:hypothetical protein BaRGS_00018079 [Batillaria attramentaria]|uniref:Uncharacterized protein n=1 Tax=Batillaria attramentaria TaxID=370345 RepID=A0ABD0KV61_9CAEN
MCGLADWQTVTNFGISSELPISNGALDKEKTECRCIGFHPLHTNWSGWPVGLSHVTSLRLQSYPWCYTSRLFITLRGLRRANYKQVLGGKRMWALKVSDCIKPHIQTTEIQTLGFRCPRHEQTIPVYDNRKEQFQFPDMNNSISPDGSIQMTAAWLPENQQRPAEKNPRTKAEDTITVLITNREAVKTTITDLFHFLLASCLFGLLLPVVCRGGAATV